MKNIESNSRVAAAALRSRSLIAYLVLYTVICLPMQGMAFNTPPSALTLEIGSSPRQVTQMRVDKTFNTTGYRTDRFARSNDRVANTVLQPDGKVIVGVITSSWWNSGWPNSYSGFEIARLNADGSKDETFTNECKRDPQPSGSFPLIALQTDGKILTTGFSSSIMRCNADGTVDRSFGVDGLQPTGLNFTPSNIALQSDGKIVLGGTSTGNFAVARLNDAGTPDTSFGTDGIALAALPTASLAAIALQPDGKIVTAGSSAGDFAVVRFNVDGSPDTTFDDDGKVTTPIFAGNDRANDVVVQPDGKIVASGTSLNSPLSTSGVFTLVRYNSNGSLDMSFDGDGKAATPVVNMGTVLLASSIGSIDLQPDGKIIAAGQTHNGKNFDHAAARYNVDGSLDTSFGDGGFVVPPIPAQNDHREENPREILHRPDGAILLIGQTTDWLAGVDITLWQLNTDGSPDTSYGTGGKIEHDFAGQRTYGTTAAFQPDGKMLVGGAMSTGTVNGAEISFIARFNQNGSRDTSFGREGFVLHDHTIRNMAVSVDGKIAVGGSRRGFSSFNGAIARYNSDGSLDMSFDTDGIVFLSIDSEGVESIEFQPDGKIVLLSGNQVARLTTDGLLDTSFDGDGRAHAPLAAAVLRLQPDGKFLVGGQTNSDFAVARLNADGTPDTTFDGDGLVTTNVSGDDYVFDIAMQPDGKIVALGQYRPGCCTSPTAFIRYTPDGSIDTSFGDNGKSLFPNASAYRHLSIQPNGKIMAGGGHIIRLNSDGLADSTFFGDGVVAFQNSKFGADPTPHLTFSTFDSQGRVVYVGSDRFNSGSNDNKASFVGRVEFVNRSYVQFDHDADGKADLAVYRPSTSTWHVMTPDKYTVTGFGQTGDRPIPADYDGDGVTDLAVFRQNGSSWSILNSESQSTRVLNNTGTSVMPITADGDGDGIDDVAYFRNGLPNQLATVTIFSGSNSSSILNFGVPGDRPVRGDFSGDGQADVALFRPSNRNWYIMSAAESQGFYAVQWGEDGDVPVPADYDGDGTTDIAVWRPSTGQWWIQGSSAGWMIGTVWGEPGDKPVPADYDGDGKTDIAVWRPSNGTWYLIHSSTSNIIVEQFGEEGDIPLPNAYIN